MKFHTSRTATRSSVSGFDAYVAEIAAGRLRGVDLPVRTVGSPRPHVLAATALSVALLDGATVDDVDGFVIEPRAFVLDEVTRHRQTPQLFVPLDGPVVAVAIPGQDGEEEPNERLASAEVVLPGELVRIPSFAWHTLPFALAGPVRILTVIGPSSQDDYHDVRDLAASGWVGWLRWFDD